MQDQKQCLAINQELQAGADDGNWQLIDLPPNNKVQAANGFIKSSYPNSIVNE